MQKFAHITIHLFQVCSIPSTENVIYPVTGAGHFRNEIGKEKWKIYNMEDSKKVHVCTSGWALTV